LIEVAFCIFFFLSFSLLIGFRLELLQAIILIAVQLSAAVFLATCFKYRSPGLPTSLFPPHCSFNDAHYKLVMPDYMPNP
jgi:hypothetical protein